jgi:hypothetical protein
MFRDWLLTQRQVFFYFIISSKQTIGQYINEGVTELFLIRPNSLSKIWRYVAYEAGRALQNKRRNKHLVHNIKTSLNTSRRRILEKLIVVQQITKYHAFYDTKRLILILFILVRHTS